MAGDRQKQPYLFRLLYSGVNGELKMKRLAVLTLLLTISAAPAPAGAEDLFITDVVEAQYSGCEGATAAFKSKTLRNVTKACVGKKSCRMVSRAEADELGCNKLIVRLTCSDDGEREFVRSVSGAVMKFSCE
jgi:hypothetical protein